MAGILHKPYKEMTLRVAHPSSIKSYYKCWAAVELIRRVVIIVFIAVAPGNLVSAQHKTKVFYFLIFLGSFAVSYDDDSHCLHVHQTLSEILHHCAGGYYNS